MNDEVVARLYRCLVEELDRLDHPEDRPVKLSHLYQELVPYRSVRSALGVELKADYEHALLRLLAGEGGRLRLEPEQAREELQQEVEQPYPFVGMFRKFSASDVWIGRRAPAHSPESPADPVADEVADPATEHSAAKSTGGAATAPAEPSAPPRPSAGASRGRIAADADGSGRGPRRIGVVAAAAAPVQLHREVEPEPRPEDAEALPSGGAPCAFCEEALPAGRRVRFCPHCGGDQRLRPCPRCDAVLERAWRFCINCGHEQRAD